MTRWGKLVAGVPVPIVLSKGYWLDGDINHPVSNFKNAQFRTDNNIVEILSPVLGEYDLTSGGLLGYDTVVLNETYREQYNTLTKSKDFIAGKKKTEVNRQYESALGSPMAHSVSGTPYYFPTDAETRIKVASYTAMLANGRTYDVSMKVTTVDVLSQAEIDAGDSLNTNLVRVPMTLVEFEAYAGAMTDKALALLINKGDHIEQIEDDLADELVTQADLIAYDTSTGW